MVINYELDVAQNAQGAYFSWVMFKDRPACFRPPVTWWKCREEDAPLRGDEWLIPTEDLLICLLTMFETN